ncbi:MAG: sigma-70 family RNA polymerase sigma factor [Clostridia bacterium]|nr:sigma-70 family RNA polymerase sigma factor [Clostridia bacterium]
MNNKEKQTNITALTDEQIIDMYWKRDENAILETDKKYGNYLFKIANNIVNNRLDCEECVNDTYLGTWNRIPPERPNIFRVFLAKIVRNIAVSRFRKNSAQKRIPSEFQVSLDELGECISTNSSAEDEYLTARVVEILNTYLKSLPRRKELIFICRYYYADKISNIARMLGVSENTVYRDLGEIRMGLKEQLRREGYGFEE